MKRWKTILIILFIFTLGFFIRYAHIDKTPFGTNEARDYERAVRQVKDGKMQVYGLEVFGLNARMPGPAYYYLLSIPVCFSTSLRGMSLFFVIMNSLSILLLYFFTKKYTGKNLTALLAAFLFAVYPWPVKFSTAIWNPYLVGFFVLLYMILLLTWIRNDKAAITSFFIFPVCSIIIQLHITGLFLGLIPLFFLIFFKQKRKNIFLWTGLTVSLLVIFVPFFILEFNSNFQNIKSLFSGPSFKIHPEVLRIISFSFLSTSLEISSFFTDNFQRHINRLDFPYPFFWIFISSLVFSIIFSLRSYWEFFREIFRFKNTSEKFKNIIIENKEKFLVFFWISLPLLFILITLKPSEPRYVALFLPASFLILGEFFEKRLRKFKEFSSFKKIAVASYFIFPIVLSIAFLHPPISSSKPGDYEVIKNLADFVKNKSDNKVYVSGDSIELIPPFKYHYKINCNSNNIHFKIIKLKNYTKENKSNKIVFRSGRYIVFKN